MKKPKTPESQLAAWRKWAEANPEKAQKNRNAWAQSPAGKAWLAKNQAKKNKARDKWRAAKKKEAKAKAKSSLENNPGQK